MHTCTYAQTRTHARTHARTHTVTHALSASHKVRLYCVMDTTVLAIVVILLRTGYGVANYDKCISVLFFLLYSNFHITILFQAFFRQHSRYPVDHPTTALSIQCSQERAS